MSLPLRAPLGQARFAGGHVAWLSGTTQTILVGMLFEAPATFDPAPTLLMRLYRRFRRHPYTRM